MNEEKKEAAQVAQQESQSAPSMNDATKDWSEQDRAWLEKNVPENLRTIAVRYGRPLFTIVMQAGAATFALSTLHANVRHPGLQQMVRTLTKTMDQMCVKALKGIGAELKQFHECKTDVERVAALQDAGQRLPGDRISKGGIILDS